GGSARRSGGDAAPGAQPLAGQEDRMIRDADVVVIGSGGLGAATAYFLMRRGDRRVALVDRHALASQTSPRAAGNAAMLRSSDLMTRLARRAVAWLPRSPPPTRPPPPTPPPPP